MGQSGAPASISQALIPSSSTTSQYFAETFVERRWTDTVYEEDILNKVIKFGSSATASVKQDSNNERTYTHEVYLHGGTAASTPIVKSLRKAVAF